MAERTLVALDLETTGLKPKRDAIIEIGAVRMQGDRIESEFSTLVNPGRPIPLFIQQITGISDADVADAPSLEAVIPELLSFVDSSVEAIIAHNAKFDLGFLKQAGVRFHRPAYDTFELATILVHGAPSYSLGELCAYFDIPLEDAHRATADARATAQLFARLRKRIGTIPASIRELLARKGAESGWPAHRLFADASSVVRSGPQQAPTPSMVNNGSGSFPDASAESIETFFGSKGPLAAHLGAAYEPRAGQTAMARTVLGALRRGEHHVIEAGTGIGKSLAYLLPAALWSRASGERVLIATHTLALQDQLLEHELPRLRRILSEYGGRPLESALLKGRSHYLCTRRLHRWYRGRKLKTREMRLLARILVWLPSSESGDLGDLTIYDTRERALLSQIASHSAECSEERCSAHVPSDEEAYPFGLHYQDFYLQARRRAEAADLLIVNHALLLANLQTGGRVLPEYQHLIVDEAHHLEEAATSQLTLRIEQATIQAILNDLVPDSSLLSHLDTEPELMRTARTLQRVSQQPDAQIQEFAEQLSNFARRHWNEKQAGFPQRLPLDSGARVQPEWSGVEIAWEQLREQLNEVLRAARNLIYGLEAARWGEVPGRSGALQRFRLALDRAEALVEEMDHTLFQPVGESETISWIEVESNKGPGILCSAPLQVSSLLDEGLFRPLRTLILTGATLRTGAGFEFMRDRLGCWEAQVSVIDSPFDYRRNALLYTPSDMPTPDRSGYQRALEQAIIAVARAAGGRTLVLFTSYAHLRATADQIRSRLDHDKINVLQYGSGGRRRALRDFRSGGRSVLLATGALWEGIDLPGEQLSCLMIARLPFAVPSDPLHAARSRLYEDGFGEYSLPDAVLRFRQGFGRLIRRADDRGVVVLLDSRIWQKSYGDAFLDALPTCTRRHAPLMNLEETVSDWLERRSWGLGESDIDLESLFGNR